MRYRQLAVIHPFFQVLNNLSFRFSFFHLYEGFCLLLRARARICRVNVFLGN
jgi:hypothetical protein